MKYIYRFLLFILLASNVHGQNFVTLLNPYIKDLMNDIFFVTEQTGWMCGSKGLIYKTTDGGNTWGLQPSGVTETLQKIYFLNQNFGYIGTVNGSVLKTTNGGTTWTEYSFANLVPAIAVSYCNGLYFTDQNTGFMIAGITKNFYLFKTTNGGVNWAIKDSLITTDVSIQWYDMDFYGGQNGVLISSKKNYQKYTTNGGNTWTLSTAITDNFFNLLRTVKWLSPTTVIALGEGNEYNGIPIPIYKSTNGGKDWVKKNQSVISCMDRARDSYFKNGSEGLVVGSNGFTKTFMIKTADSGETWTTYTFDFDLGMQAISGVNNTVYCLGTDSHVIKSTDFGISWTLGQFTTPSSIYGFYSGGGKSYAMNRNGDFYVANGSGNNWQFLSSTGANDCYSMDFINSTTGLMLKENHHIVKTTDGGQTWRVVLTPVPYNSRNKVGGITFADNSTAYAWFSMNDYGEYHIFKSTDVGETWNQVYTGTGPGYIAGGLVFFDANTGVILGPNMYMLRTSDGGTTWAQANANNFPAGFSLKDFEGVAKINNTKAIAIGDQFMCSTTDKGLNWNYINHNLTGFDTSFYCISFSGQDTGYVACYNGVLLKTTDGGNSWNMNLALKDSFYIYTTGFNQYGKLLMGTSMGLILGDEAIIAGIKNKKENILPEKYVLSQNYPNPFNPVTSIEYSIPSLTSGNIQHVLLKIYDILGNEIVTLVNKDQPAGNYKVSFNAASLPSGVYFYRLNSGSFVQTRKMILVK